MVSPNSEIRISHYFIKVLHIKHFIQKKKKKCERKLSEDRTADQTKYNDEKKRENFRK